MKGSSERTYMWGKWKFFFSSFTFTRPTSTTLFRSKKNLRYLWIGNPRTFYWVRSVCVLCSVLEEDTSLYNIGMLYHIHIEQLLIVRNGNGKWQKSEKLTDMILTANLMFFQFFLYIFFELMSVVRFSLSLHTAAVLFLSVIRSKMEKYILNWLWYYYIY